MIGFVLISVVGVCVESLLEALAKSWKTVMSDNGFLELLESAKDPRSRALLTAFAETLLGHITDAQSGKFLMPAAYQNDAKLESFRRLLQEKLQFARAILCLFSPATHGAEAQAVLDLLEYKGRDIFTKAVRIALAKDTLDATDITEQEKAHKKYLLDAVKDIKRTAASQALATPDFRRAQGIAQQAHPSIEDLMWLHGRWDALVHNLRAGQMREVTEALAQHAVNQAGRIFTGTGDLAVEADTVTFLLEVLQKHRKLPKCMDAESKLSAWATKHNSSMAKNEVKTMITKFCRSADASETGVPDSAFPCQRFLTFLHKCKSSAFSSEADKDMLQDLIAYLLKDAFRKVLRLHWVVNGSAMSCVQCSVVC